MAGEVSWRVPSLSLADEAIELFTDRARLARPDFAVTDDNAAAVAEICARLDGLPLAIELAAARVRALSLAEILDSLHDRFRLLTGGARTAVRRQQTLRASVDWSHALLTEPERVLFRRLAAFLGGFDLHAAQTVAGGGDIERYQVLDLLTLLVDKSLVVADDSAGPNPLPAAGDGAPIRAGKARRVRRGRCRAARATATTTRRWRRCSMRRQAVITSSASSRPKPRSTTCAPRSGGAAKTPTSSWRWRWRRRCSRCGKREAASGKGWPGSTPPSPTPTRSTLGWRPRCGRGRSPTGPCSPYRVGAADSLDQAQQALAIAREVDDPALLTRALTACGISPRLRRPRWPGRTSPRRSAWPGHWTTGGGSATSSPRRRSGSVHAGDPIAVRAAGEEGRDLADAIGDRSGLAPVPLVPRTGTANAGRSGRSRRTIRAQLAAEAEAAHDAIFQR